MTEELITAKKIIQLLQEDLNTYKDLARPRALDGRNTTNLNSKPSVNWETVTGTTTKYTKVRHEHQYIPVIPISNRYSALHNLQNEMESHNS